MRISAFLLFIGILQVFASDSYSQVTRLTLSMSDATIQQVLEEIEDQSEFFILFNHQLVDVNRKVNIDVSNKKISNILTALFKDTDVEYLVMGRQIILSTGEILNESVAKKQLVQDVIVVKGTIVDSDGNPVPGVNVVVKGTNQGTISDVNGLYSINVEDPNATLVFSFIGMLTQEIQVGNQTVINLTMARDAVGLEEVVTIGYASRKAGEITGSISSVGAAEIERVVAQDVGEAMRGFVSGVTITQSNTPGSEATIRIRGLGSINDNDPLWVVDGVPGGFAHPSEIKSITILKDAASQAIYGARASNGVILVTTKTGRRNQPIQVDVTVRQGFKRNVRKYDLLNTQEYGEMLWLKAKNDGIIDYSHPQFGNGDIPHIPNYIRPAGAETANHSLYDNQFIHEDGTDTYIIMMANKEGTDWMDEITQDAYYQEYNLRLSGGSDITNYALQIGYLDEEGILKYTSYDRYNIRSNVTMKPTKWLEIGQRMGLTYGTTWGRLADHGEGSSIAYTYRMQPIVPVYDIMGNYAGTRAESTGNARNPAFLQFSNRYNNDKELRTTGNFYAKATILEGLSFQSLIGFNYGSQDGSNYSYPERAFAERTIYNSASKRSDYNFQYNWANTLQYHKKFALVHDFTLMLGSEAIENTASWSGGSRDSFFSDDPNYMQLDVGELNQSNFGNSTEWSLFSLFGRANYIYDNKYILEAVVRRDGSSRFGTETRYGIFPAFSFGWRLSNENFMSFATNDWLDNLMLRIGYGQTGNDRVGNYNAYSTYASNVDDSYYPITGENVGVGTPGFYAQSRGNSSVAWESSTTYNIGLNGNFFRGLSLSFDLWKRITQDMLFPKRLPDVIGQVSAPSINVGEMLNKGFDIELGYQGAALNQELKYSASLTASRYQNEIIKLSDVESEQLEGDEFRGQIYTIAEAGSAFPVFYGYQVDGIFQTEQEAENHPPAFDDYNAPGHFKFRDVNEDGVIDSDDRTIIGDPHPDFVVGLNLNLSYKGFFFSTLLYGSYGNEMVNYVNRWIDFNQFQGNRSKKRLYESWGSPYLDSNEDATMPIASFSDAIELLPSSYYVEDASYLRMENLRLGYDISKVLNLKTRNFEIYIHLNNVFTITKYTGLDPEVNRTGMDRGIDAGAWPTSRQFMFGINIGI